MPEASAAVQQAYNTWVDRYDTDANPTRDLNAKVLRQQPFDFDNKVVLEIGCGTGLNTLWLAERAQRVLALDLAEGMLRHARRRLGHQMNVSLLQADLTKPWPLARVFDVILANLVLEHVSDLAHVFAQAHHVLRPGGLLYISELHPYKQWQGSQARYRHPESGETVLVPAFRHSVSEFINAGIAAGLTLRRMEEWHSESDEPPRLMILLFALP